MMYKHFFIFFSFPSPSPTLFLKFTWPEFQTSEEVQVEEFWVAMESEALELAAFPSSVSITRFDASIIAPFFPPLMRSAVVINTEKDKINTATAHTGEDQYHSDHTLKGPYWPETGSNETEFDSTSGPNILKED